jgi:hypothetical protein
MVHSCCGDLALDRPVGGEDRRTGCAVCRESADLFATELLSIGHELGTNISRDQLQQCLPCGP